MSIEKINFQSGAGYKIYRLELSFLNRFCQSIDDTADTVIIREQWLDTANYNNIISNLSSNVRRLVKVAMLDEIKIETFDKNKFKEIISLGHYPYSDYYINFIAYMFYKHMKKISFDSKNIDVAYMCLNGKPHYHRLKIFEDFKNSNLLTKGFVSFNSHGNIMPDNKKIISYKLDDNKNILNNIPSDYNVFDYGRIDYWNRHFLNVVTETLPDPDNRNFFLTEKTYKPIYGFKPFLIYAPNGAKKSLNYIGIEEYNNDFDDICDLDLYKTDNIIPFIKILSDQSSKYFRKKYKSLLPKIFHNRDVFIKFCQQQEFKYNHMIYKGKT